MRYQTVQYYSLLPFLFILCPTIPKLLSDGMGDRIIFMIEILTLLFLYQKHVFKIKLSSNAAVVLIYFILSIFIDIVQDLLKGVTVASDFIELIRPLSFFLFYSFYRYSSVGIKNIEEKTLRTILTLFTILSVWSIIEIVFSKYLLEISYWLYRRESLPILVNKAIGSFAQTYQFGYVLLLPLVMSFIFWLKLGGVKRLLLFMLFLVTLLLTQSKSMYVCAVLCIIVSIFLPVLYRKRSDVIKILFFVLLIVSLFYTIYITYYEVVKQILDYAFMGFDAMLRGKSNSLRLRSEQLIWALENNDLWLFGGGIGKGEIMLESFYSLYFYRYGIVGMLIYVVMVMIIAKNAYTIARKEEKSNLRISIFYYSLFVFYLITPVALSSSCHQDTTKISFLFYGLMGLINYKTDSCNKQYDSGRITVKRLNTKYPLIRI